MKKATLVFFFFIVGVFIGYGQDNRQKLEDLNRRIALEPENATFYRVRGTIYANSGQNHEALEDFNRAVSLNANVDNISTRALFYWQLEMFQDASKDFISITIIDPKSDRAYFLAGMSFFKLQKYREAFFFISTAIEINPNVAAYYGNRGSLYFNSGQFDEALADVTHAIELAPDASMYMGRGKIYRALAEQSTNKKQKADYEKKAEADFAMVEKLGGTR